MTPHESPLAPLLRFLLSSFRVGKFFGTEVRVYGAALIFVLFVALPLMDMSWLGLGDRLLYVVLVVLSLYLTVYVHEMGHALAGRRYHIRTPLITLSPLGGLAHMQGAAPSPRADIVISGAGPVTHLLTLALLWPLSLLVGGEPFSWARPVHDAAGVPTGTWTLEAVPFLVERLVELNLALLLFNLLPLYPLDGGRILRSLLALRMHPNRATLVAARIGMVGAVLLGLAGLFLFRGVGGGVMVALAITNFMACQRAVLEARYSDGPYGEPREPWEEDPDAWKYGAPQDEPAPRPRARPPRERAAPAPAEEELDRLLDRVREVGVSGLTPSERAALQRASEARRSR
jgi:Zn-dependent protease